MKHLICVVLRICGFGVAILYFMAALPVLAQQAPGSGRNSDSAAMNDAVRELQQQVTELRAAVSEVRSEAAQYRAETLALKRELEARRPTVETAGSQDSQPADSAVHEAGKAQRDEDV